VFLPKKLCICHLFLYLAHVECIMNWKGWGRTGLCADFSCLGGLRNTTKVPPNSGSSIRGANSVPFAYGTVECTVLNLSYVGVAGARASVSLVDEERRFERNTVGLSADFILYISTDVCWCVCGTPNCHLTGAGRMSALVWPGGSSRERNQRRARI